MPDELDLQTQLTEHESASDAPISDPNNPPRNSGADQNESTAPTIDPAAEANLDDLLTKETGEPVPFQADPTNPDHNAKPKETVVPDPEATDTGEVEDGGGSDDSKADDTEDADSGEGDDDSSDADDKTVEEKDDLDKIELPPHTSTKAADSFNAIKEKAREQIQGRDETIKGLQQKVTEFEQKETVTPEEKAELTDLRKFRASVEIENDPAIVAQFKTKIDGNDDTIYKTLTEVGMKDEQIESIKKMGGPNKLSNWDAIYEHLSASQKRVVDARLTENENLIRDRDIKVSEAKKNVDEFLKQRETGSKEQLAAESKVIEDTTNEMLGRMEWVAEKEVPANATPEAKTAIEADNKFAKENIETLKGLLVDRSPENHATLAIATVQALHFRRQLDTQSAELKTLREANKELTTKMAKIKKSGSSARRGSAPAKPLKAKTDVFSDTGEDAIDNLRKQVENNV